MITETHTSCGVKYGQKPWCKCCSGSGELGINLRCAICQGSGANPFDTEYFKVVVANNKSEPHWAGYIFYMLCMNTSMVITHESKDS